MVVTLVYYRLSSQQARVRLLLAASCYFYMAFVPKYILILGGTIGIDYLAGFRIAGSRGRVRRAWLILSIIANVGILVFFKYFNFLLGTIAPLAHWLFPAHPLPFLDIILPIGLSFHTFQAMSYTIEVYRGRQLPEKSFAVYALYVLFYPQLVAGPIERPQNMLPQLHHFQEYDWEGVKEGLARMLWGFFKKVVIADRLSIAVDYCFNNTATLSSGSLLTGALFYSFQIYCDFSGYSDIGIGAARVMGIRLMENFNEPYGSHTIAEFWSRWHISLSSWFRDYVYIPLGGNRRGEKRRKTNVLIVFLLSGLWHGANWTFVVWGGLHGMLTAFLPGRKGAMGSPGAMHREGAGQDDPVVGRWGGGMRWPGARRWAMVLLNFMVVTLCWVFFRAPSVKEALRYLGGIFRFKGGGFSVGLNGVEVGVSVVLILLMLLRESRNKGGGATFVRSPRLFAGYCALMLIVCYFLGVFSENQFIYFQF